MSTRRAQAQPDDDRRRGLAERYALCVSMYVNRSLLGAASVPDSSRTFAEQLSCSLKLLGFVPMHSDSQQCLNVAKHSPSLTIMTYAQQPEMSRLRYGRSLQRATSCEVNEIPLTGTPLNRWRPVRCASGFVQAGFTCQLRLFECPGLSSRRNSPWPNHAPKTPSIQSLHSISVEHLT